MESLLSGAEDQKFQWKPALQLRMLYINRRVNTLILTVHVYNYIIICLSKNIANQQYIEQHFLFTRYMSVIYRPIIIIQLDMILIYRRGY